MKKTLHYYSTLYHYSFIMEKALSANKVTWKTTGWNPRQSRSLFLSLTLTAAGNLVPISIPIS